VNNATDAANDIDFPTGVVASSAASPILMAHTGVTMQIDVAWGVGNGGRFDSAISDGTWHCFVISNGTVSSRGFSKSLDPTTQPNYPSGFTHYRRVGSILRLSSAILPFVQNEDEFDLVNAIEDRNSTAGFGDGFLTISVPSGIIVRPKLRTVQQQATTGSFQTRISSIGRTSVVARCTTSNANEVAAAFITDIFTDALARIRYEAVAFAGTVSYNVLTTYGWIDKRGRA
jgi:hypothetical protein